MAGIFGPTASQVYGSQLQQQRAMRDQALLRAQGSHGTAQQRAAGMMGHAQLGQQQALRNLGGIFNPEGSNPELDRAQKMQEVQQRIQTSGARTPEEIYNVSARELMSAGFTDESMEMQQQARRVKRENAENAKINAIIGSTLSKEQKMTEAQERRDAIALEGKRDRASREKVAGIRAGASSSRGTKPKVFRAATSSDRKQAESHIQESLGKDAWEGLDEDQQQDMVTYVAQVAKDLAQNNPGTPYQVALEAAVEAATKGVGEDTSLFGGMLGEERTFERPTTGGSVAPTDEWSIVQ